MSTSRIAIRTDEGIEKIEDVADVAEVAPGRLMIATTDGERDMTGGEIFGAFGSWKMWHDGGNNEIEQYLAETPLTMPNDVTRFEYTSGDLTYKCDRSGRIKRLKRADL